jgi:hypothetical protein
MTTRLPGQLDEAVQSVGSSEQACDIDGCLLGRIVPHCLRTHEEPVSPNEDLLTRARGEVVTNRANLATQGQSP